MYIYELRTNSTIGGFVSVKDIVFEEIVKLLFEFRFCIRIKYNW